MATIKQKYAPMLINVRDQCEIGLGKLSPCCLNNSCEDTHAYVYVVTCCESCEGDTVEQCRAMRKYQQTLRGSAAAAYHINFTDPYMAIGPNKCP